MFRHSLYTVLILIGIQSSLLSQMKSGVWGTLSMVDKVKEYDEAYGYEVEKVTVGLIAKTLQGKEIEIEGYIIPLDGKVEQSHFMLSFFPYNMCFFCGKAGPETAMQVFMADDKKVSYSDDKVKLKGTLMINENSVDGLLYTLSNGKLIK